MIKRIFFICLVAIVSYYAGSQGITPNDIYNFFGENNINKTVKKTIKKTVEFVNEKN